MKCVSSKAKAYVYLLESEDAHLVGDVELAGAVEVEDGVEGPGMSRGHRVHTVKTFLGLSSQQLSRISSYKK